MLGHPEASNTRCWSCLDLSDQPIGWRMLWLCSHFVVSMMPGTLKMRKTSGYFSAHLHCTKTLQSFAALLPYLSGGCARRSNGRLLFCRCSMRPARVCCMCCAIAWSSSWTHQHQHQAHPHQTRTVEVAEVQTSSDSSSQTSCPSYCTTGNARCFFFAA